MTQVEEIADTLTRCDSPEAAWQATVRWLEGQGFDGVFYADIGPGARHLRTTIDAEFIAHYQDQGYERVDPFFKYCCRHYGAMLTGQDFLDRHPYLTAPERRFIGAAGETGLTAGVALPARLKGPGGMAGWNLLSTHGAEHVSRHYAENSAAIRYATLLAHERMRELAPPPARDVLSARETECLQWTASGLRSKEIADRMRIREVTVEMHHRNIRVKLGAATRDHAVAIAMSRGLIAL